jgi:hypothetical protein
MTCSLRLPDVARTEDEIVHRSGRTKGIFTSALEKSYAAKEPLLDDAPALLEHTTVHVPRTRWSGLTLIRRSSEIGLSTLRAHEDGIVARDRLDVEDASASGSGPLTSTHPKSQPRVVVCNDHRRTKTVVVPGRCASRGPLDIVCASHPSVRQMDGSPSQSHFLSKFTSVASPSPDDRLRADRVPFRFAQLGLLMAQRPRETRSSAAAGNAVICGRAATQSSDSQQYAASSCSLEGPSARPPSSIDRRYVNDPVVVVRTA